MSFNYTGYDTTAMFMVVTWTLVGGAPILPWWAWHLGGTLALGAWFCAFCLILMGLRFSVTASDREVRIRRTWFSIPYARHKGHAIEDIEFDGDWGAEAASSGIVVILGGKEVHIGSRRSMRHLYSSLLPFVLKRGEQGAVES